MATQLLEGLDFGSLSTIDVRGTQIELLEAGSGPPLLFLHGIDGLEGAADLLRQLSGQFTVYAPSHPGFGASQQREGLNRVDDMAYFTLDLMDQLGLDKPIIVGTCFGGWLAAEMLTKEPGRASELMLVSPFGLRTAQRREQYVTDIFMLSRQQLGERLQTGEPGPLQDLAGQPEERIRRAMRNDEALSLYGWTPYMFNPKLEDRLHRISCPTLIVWGGKDGLMSETYRSAFDAAMPQAESETYPEAGHRVHSDAADKLAERIAAFAGR